MEIMSLLSKVDIPVFGQTFEVSLNWIGKLIRGLIRGAGSVGLGIILFSLCLKLITLPLDIFQRVSMRKQNNKMRDNKERMERLKKQYANDEKTYNQKVMEMYKEGGFSMFASCLPMIASLVIFIVAINAFNAFSQYAVVENYNTMVDSYNKSMTAYCPDLQTEQDYKDNVAYDAATNTILVKSDDATEYIYYEVAADETYVTLKTWEERVAYIQTATTKKYMVDVAKVDADKALSAIINPDGTLTGEDKNNAIYNYFVGNAQAAVEQTYHDEVKGNTKFLWVKNIWSTDAHYKHPVTSYSGFKSEASRKSFYVENQGKVGYGSIAEYTDAYSEDAYNVITAKLDAQKSQANGYYILILMSIGTILLQQWVMMRSQKHQQQYGSMNGGGQQKMTMIIMTGMFAIFSFMYSSAFTIYMVTSNVFTMFSTFIINYFVDAVGKKKEAVAVEKSYKNHSLERIEAAKNQGKSSAEKSKNKKK